jgi:hypothetical protein
MIGGFDGFDGGGDDGGGFGFGFGGGHAGQELERDGKKGEDARDRNREHARNTRLRKKQYVNCLWPFLSFDIRQFL